MANATGSLALAASASVLTILRDSGRVTAYYSHHLMHCQLLLVSDDVSCCSLA